MGRVSSEVIEKNAESQLNLPFRHWSVNDWSPFYKGKVHWFHQPLQKTNKKT